MRRLLVDASVFITVAEIDHIDLLASFEGTPTVSSGVADEVQTEPAASALEDAADEGWLHSGSSETETAPDRTDEWTKSARKAASHLGMEEPGENWHGDVALLARALEADEVVVVTDDKSLRKTCKALGIPVSGSLGVVIAAVERGDLAPEEAKEALVAMDEVGARLSARLLRRAERLIDQASEG